MKDVREVIDELHNKIDIVEFISRYVKLKKQGQNYVGLCPFHQEKTPSFVVSPTRQLYHCFGCGQSGDIVTFLMHIENMSFKEAVTTLAKEANIEASFNLREENIDRTTLYKINDETAKYFESQLKGAPYDYLASRGLPAEVIKKYRFGFIGSNSKELYELLIKSGFRKEDILRTGNFRVDSANNVVSYFHMRIMIPIFDLSGNIIGFSGRSFDGGDPKYLNSVDSPIFKKGETLYLLNFSKEEIRGSKKAIIVEGYFDAIALFENGIKNVVSSMGTSFTESQARLLKRFADTFYFFFDNDEGGSLGSERAVEVCNKFDITPLIVVPEEKLDPDEIILKFGKSAIDNLLENAKDPVFFILDHELAHSGNSTVAKNKSIKKVLEVISRIQDKTIVYQYLKEISSKLKIDNRFLVDSYNKLNSSKKKVSNEKVSVDIKDKTVQIQEVFTQAILQRKETAKDILLKFGINEFIEPYRKIVLRALEDIDAGREPNPNSWLDLDEQTLNKAVEIYLRDPYLVRNESIDEHLEAYQNMTNYEERISTLFEELKNVDGAEKLEKLKEVSKLIKDYKGKLSKNYKGR